MIIIIIWCAVAAVWCRLLPWWAGAGDIIIISISSSMTSTGKHWQALAAIGPQQAHVQRQAAAALGNHRVHGSH